MTSLKTATWAEINACRDRLEAPPVASIEEAADRMVRVLTSTFGSVVLARVFVVLPARRLPPTEHAFAAALAGPDATLSDPTPVLTLLGTAGRENDWGDRHRSKGHLAIPLLNRSFVEGIPMLAKLLADIDANLAGLDTGAPVASRRLLGGKNGMFFVPDASAAVDRLGRAIIPSREFVARHGVRTVFGMGGAYADGTLAVAIVFTQEALDRATADRYPSFISNFKIATTLAQQDDRVFVGDAGKGPTLRRGSTPPARSP